MKVSILVPIYGVEKYIERCARSLFEQTYENIEFIFVNDCTKDRSIDILKTVLNDYPNRACQTKIINHEKNKGLGGARNTAVAAASGEFLMHVDSDDYVDIHLVEKVVAVQQTYCCDIVNFGARKVLRKGQVLFLHPEVSNKENYVLDMIKLKSPYHIWSRLIRTSLYKDHDVRVVEGANFGEDVQVSAILAYYAKKIVSIPDVYYFYDCSNENSYTNNFSQKKLEQSWLSHAVVSKFFLGKGAAFDNAVREATINRCISHLVVSAKIKDGDCFYKEAIQHLNSLNNDYRCGTRMSKRVLLYICKYRWLMNLYIRVALKFR